MDINIQSLLEQMPDFNSHEEARTWLKSQFQDKALLKGTDVADGKRIFFYHLIKDEEKYEQYMDTLAHPEIHNEITDMEPFKSYTTIEVSEDGGISIWE